jgi:hypothetical protein
MYCEFSDHFKDNKFIMEALYNRVDGKFLQYYRYYGTKGCSSKNYLESELQAGWKDATKSDLLIEEIYNNFSVGDRITMSDAKIKLSDIYKKLNLSKTAKASDLKEYFRLTETNAKDSSGKFKKGFNFRERLQ